MKTYTIVEIFPSLQGEGARAGSSVTFVRFAGCNLQCSFCDTDKGVKRLLTAAQIVEEVEQYPSPNVVLTGGEPSLQVDKELVSLLQHHGFNVAMETNGTNTVDHLGLDWITVSPKGPDGRAIDPARWKQRSGNELKVLFPDATADHIMMDTSSHTFQHHFVQPVDEKGLRGINTRNAVKFCMANPRWRLSLQVHKILEIQ